MSDTLSLDPAARCVAGDPYDFGLNPQSGNGFAADSAARFQDALANAAQVRDSGSALDLDASAPLGSTPVKAAFSVPASTASSTAPQQASDGQPAASSALGGAWDWTKHQASAASQAIGGFDAAHSHVLTRAAGAVQAVGAVAEGLAGAAMAGVGGAATATGVGAAPGVPAMIGGGALMANALDNGVAGVRTALTGEFHHTLTSQAAGAGARALGASDQTAERITSGVDLAQGVAGGGASIMAGIARKGAVEGVESAAKQSLTKGISDAAASRPTAEELTKALPGHGNARHGAQTTITQQTTRVQTGLAPDGKMAPTTLATRFDSPEAQLDAVNRALSRTNARDANGLIPHEIAVTPNGSARLPRDQSVVSGHSGGYGSGVQLQKPIAPGRPVAATGQLPNALVILERQPATGRWHPVTQYPTNKPVTP